jgi:hypothetical protein
MGVKKKRCDMGKVPFDENLWKAYRWCIRNNIAIGPKSRNDTAWYITIEINNKVNTTPVTYGKTEIWTKIFEYAKYYYDKHRK